MADTSVVLIHLVDYKGATGNVKLHLPAGQTVTEVEAFLAIQCLGYLDPCIGPMITGATLVEATELDYGVVSPVPKTSPIDDVDVERGANLAFDAINTSYRHTVRIPGWLPLWDDGNVPDSPTLHVPFSNFINVSMLAGDTGLVVPCDRNGNDLIAYQGGKITFHKKR